MAYGFRKMVDMARSPSEIKKDIESCPSPMSDAPVYPYGLCLSLDEDILDKLEIDGDCEVGDMIHLVAMAKVTSCSESERETAGGEKKRSCRIELQIVTMGVENESTEDAGEEQRETRAKKRYAEGHEEGSGNVDAGEMHIGKKRYEAA
jgi:hypothetical protein